MRAFLLVPTDPTNSPLFIASTIYIPINYSTQEIMCFTIGPLGYKLHPDFEPPPGFLRAATAADADAVKAAAADKSPEEKSNSRRETPPSENPAVGYKGKGKST